MKCSPSSPFISFLFHTWLDASDTIVSGGVSINIQRAEQLHKSIKGQFFIDDITSLYFLPTVSSLKCTLTPLIMLSLPPFQKMIRAAFYLRNRERNCQTARCCPDCSPLCLYFVSFSWEPFQVMFQVPTTMVPSKSLLNDSGPTWIFRD